MAITNIPNFSKVINLKLTTEERLDAVNLAMRNYAIKCPVSGRKPNIEIEGTLTNSDSANNFIVRIKNFFTDQLKGSITTLEVQAGYASSIMTAFKGTVDQLYTESPGPERTTVICCTDMNLNSWLSSSFELHLEPGWTLSMAIQRISDALKLINKPVIEAVDRSCPSAWDFTGMCREALHELPKFFSDVTVQVRDNRLYVYDKKRIAKKRIILDYLSCAPQISGDGYTITAPWNPGIKPGDIVGFSTKYFSTNTRNIFYSKSYTEVEVVFISFSFSTVDNTNQMVIQGTTPGGKL